MQAITKTVTKDAKLRVACSDAPAYNKPFAGGACGVPGGVRFRCAHRPTSACPTYSLPRLFLSNSFHRVSCDPFQKKDEEG